VCQGQAIPYADANGKRYAKIIPATTWNNFTNAVNAMRQYRGNAAYTFTSVKSYVTPTDCTVFTPAVFNESVNAINEMYEAGIVQKVKQPISAQYFKDLQDALNNTPDACQVCSQYCMTLIMNECGLVEICKSVVQAA
jgi:hypothetical protein